MSQNAEAGVVIRELVCIWVFHDYFKARWYTCTALSVKTTLSTKQGGVFYYLKFADEKNALKGQVTFSRSGNTWLDGARSSNSVLPRIAVFYIGIWSWVDWGASLVTQMVKNLLAMQDTWVPFLGWEDPLEKGNGYPPQYTCLENSMDRGAWWATAHEITKSWTWLSN